MQFLNRLFAFATLILLSVSGDISRAVAQDASPVQASMTLFPAGISEHRSRLTFFEIYSQPVSDALIAFALQGNLSIGLQGLDAGGAITPRVSGLYTASDGLRQLLSGSGLSFDFVDSGTVRVFRDAQAEPQRVDAGGPGQRQFADVRRRRLVLEELLVTSTKRERAPQDIAVSVAIVGSDQIEAMDVRDMSDLTSLVAGLSVTNQGPGRNKIFLRGQSDGPIAERTQSTVGIYIDESPLVFSDTNPDFRLLDVKRVEVLRGPQGTLFGAGSLGGTFRIITNKPDPSEALGRVSLSGGFTNSGAPSYAAEGIVNMPILEGRSALRVAAFYDRFGGFIDDVRLGEENINSAKIFGGRASLSLDVSDAWSVIATGNAQKIDLEDTQYYSPDLGLLIRANYVREPRRDQFYQGGLNVKGDLGWAEFLSATTYIRRRIQNVSDASLGVPDLLDLPIVPSPFSSRNKIATLAQEVRLSHEGKRIDWLVGAFYLDRDENLKTSFTVPGAGLVFADTGFPTDVVFEEDRDDDVSKYAAFGDFTFRLFPSLEFSLGLRWNRAILDVSSLTMAVLSGRVEETDVPNREDAVTPRLSASYAISPTTTLYAQAAKGFRVGGVNINTPISALFDPELDPDESLQTQTFTEDSLWNYEIGFKSKLFDDRLRIDAAAFYVNWTAIQTDQVLPTGFLFVTNAGNARNYGFELQVAAQLTGNLTVTAVGIWNDPKLTKANTFLNAERGDRLPAIAAFTGGLGLYYSRPISDQMLFDVSLDYSFVGSSRLFFDRDLSPRMDAFHKAGLRVGLGWSEWKGKFTISNLFNNRGNTFAYGNSFSLNSTSQFTPLRPRTFGLEISREF